MCLRANTNICQTLLSLVNNKGIRTAIAAGPYLGGIKDEKVSLSSTAFQVFADPHNIPQICNSFNTENFF